MSDRVFRKAVVVMLENFMLVFLLMAGLSGGGGGLGAGPLLSLLGLGLVVLSGAVVVVSFDQPTEAGSAGVLGAAGVLSHVAGVAGIVSLVMVVAG